MHQLHRMCVCVRARVHVHARGHAHARARPSVCECRAKILSVAGIRKLNLYISTTNRRRRRGLANSLRFHLSLYISGHSVFEFYQTVSLSANGKLSVTGKIYNIAGITRKETTEENLYIESIQSTVNFLVNYELV